MTITIGPTEEWYAKREGPIITNNLIAYYDARKVASYPGSGSTIYDLSGLNNDATIYNSLAYSGDFVFDGSNYFFTPNLAGSFGTSRDQTLEAWIYPTDNQVTVFSETSGQVSYGWYDNQIEFSGGTVKGAVWPMHPGYVGIGYFAINDWYHVVLTYNNSTHELTGYLNGVQGSITTVSRQNPIDYSGGVIYFGIGHNTSTSMSIGGSQNFIGKMSQVRVYSSALNSTEVSTNFVASKAFYGK